MGLSSSQGLKSKHTNQAENIETWMRCNSTIIETNLELQNLTRIMAYFYREKYENLPQLLREPSLNNQIKIRTKFIRTKAC